MALAATPKPLTIKDVDLSVGTTDYRAHVNSVMLTPSTTISTWRGAQAGSNQNEGTTPAWTLDITYVQDWDTAGSFCRYLWDNQNSEVTVTFKPRSGGTGFTVKFIAIVGGIGGALDAVATVTSSFPVNGQPTLVPAA